MQHRQICRKRIQQAPRGCINGKPGLAKDQAAHKYSNFPIYKFANGSKLWAAMPSNVALLQATLPAFIQLLQQEPGLLETVKNKLPPLPAPLTCIPPPLQPLYTRWALLKALCHFLSTAARHQNIMEQASSTTYFVNRLQFQTSPENARMRMLRIWLPSWHSAANVAACAAGAACVASLALFFRNF